MLAGEKGKIMAKFRSVLLIAALVIICCAPVFASENLIANGGFETNDLSNWTSWNASWSNNFTAGTTSLNGYYYSGKYALKLSIAGSASFGVYQQVAVTPGQLYQLDGSWKGSAGTNNWFEIILIDGAFSLDAADSSPGVFQNVVTGFDSSSDFGYPAPYFFGWKKFSEMYNQEVSQSITNGTRMASGSIMTVVLKLGSNNRNYKPYACFDDISLVAVPEPASLAALVTGLAGMSGIAARVRKRR